MANLHMWLNGSIARLATLVIFPRQILLGEYDTKLIYEIVYSMDYNVVISNISSSSKAKHVEEVMQILP